MKLLKLIPDNTNIKFLRWRVPFYAVSLLLMAASLSLVGGISFNSFTLEESPFRDGLALEVDNSLAVRPGVSLWVDLNSRAAFNVFAGYVMTRPQVTYLERDEFTKRALRADTGVFSVGLAYKVF